MEKEIEQIFDPSMLEEAARLYGRNTEQFKKLGDFENYVYEADPDGEPYIIRLTHSSHRTEEEVRAELDWIYFLTDEGIDIPRCYLSSQENLTEVIRARTGESYFTISVFDKASGHHVDVKKPEEWNAELFRAWGEVTGRMHEATKRYKAPAGTALRPAWHEDLLLRDADQYILPGDAFVQERLDTVLRQLYQLPCDLDAYGLIHTDIHPGNFFVEQGRISVFDFDDCGYNWFVHDIAIPLYYSLLQLKLQPDDPYRETFSAQFIRAFWSGYSSVCSLPKHWLKQMRAFLMLRDITLYLVINQKVEPQDRDERLTRWMEEITDRIRRDAAIVEMDFHAVL